MNRSTPGLPVYHQLPEFTQTHIHRVSEAIQPSHPLSSPSPLAPNPSQHQSLFQWVNSSHEVAKVLEFQLWHHSFQRNPRADLLQNGLVGSPCSPRDSQESFPTPQYLCRNKTNQHWKIWLQSNLLPNSSFKLLFGWKHSFFRKQSYLNRFCPGIMGLSHLVFRSSFWRYKNVIFKESTRWHLWCIQ